MKLWFAVFTLLCTSVQAALIDNDTYTTQSEAGLDWLDFTFTFETSVADALTENPGWRLATNSEVEGLFAEAFATYRPNDFDGPTFADSSSTVFPYPLYSNHYQDIANWYSLFGINYQLAGTSRERRYSRGLYQDENGDWRSTGVVETERDFGSTISSIYGLNVTTDHSGVVPVGDITMGVFMVRTTAVPIPAAAWLFGSALIGLGWLRRKPAV